MISSVIEQLYRTSPLGDGMTERILYGRNEDEEADHDSLEPSSDCLLAFLNEEFPDGKKRNSSELIKGVLSAMSSYVRSRPSGAVRKQKIWDQFAIWIKNLAEELCVPLEKDVISSEMPEPYVEDPYIRMTKALHYVKRMDAVKYPAMTRDGLAESLQMSPQTVKEMINALDQSKPEKVVRIAGQKVELDIRHKDLFDENTGSRKRFFYAASTVNPIFLQLNVAEVNALLYGLMRSYFQDERNMSLLLAAEIWSQLSDYTRIRFRKIYLDPEHGSKEFREFLYTVIDESASLDLCRYRTERELLYEGDLSDKEIDELKQKLRTI